MRNSICLFVMIYFSVALQAQEKSFSVEVSNDSILLGNYIEVKYIMLNIDGDFDTPDFEGMEIVGGPNQASSMSSINGDVRQQKSISYFVKPLELGEFYIPPAYMTSGETNWETEALKLSVMPNPDGIIERPSQTQEFNFEFGDFFGQDDLFPERKKDEKGKAKSKVKKRKI